MGVCRLCSAAGLSQGCRAVYDEMTARLLDSAVGVFAHRGFAGARVGEIARRAGLTTGAIYARWNSKADLLAAAVAHAFEEALPEQTRTRGEPAPKTPHDLVAMFGVGIADAGEARDVIIQAAVSAAVAASLAEFLNNEARHLGRIVEAAKDAGVDRPRVRHGRPRSAVSDRGGRGSPGADRRTRRAPRPCCKPMGGSARQADRLGHSYRCARFAASWPLGSR